eukprot:GHVL01042554.1.p1 GENE.GHVL01042554.1~~GHVL01042554.1.p1  ORF type:complete len:499 (+),score=84.07 GHVL01042554.1:2001-3497(+)
MSHNIHRNRCNKICSELIDKLVAATSRSQVIEEGGEIKAHEIDESRHTPCEPDLVVFPKTTKETSEVMKLCLSFGVPVTPCGARTGLEGGMIPIKGGMSLDMSKMDKVFHLYKEELQVHVGSGMHKQQLNDYLHEHNLFFPVDPPNNPSLGGMTATGASGTLCCKFGTMKENVVVLIVVLMDGRIIRTRRRTRKNATGYDLTHLFMGQEGTLGVITELIVKVTPMPIATCSAVVGFDNLEDCSKTVAALRYSGIDLSRCELLNKTTIQCLYSDNPEKCTISRDRPALMMEVQSMAQSLAEAEMVKACEIARNNNGKDIKLAKSKEEQEALWDFRARAYYACVNSRSHLMARNPKPSDLRVLITDSCLPISTFSACISETEVDFAEHAGDLMFNVWGHAADGNFHAVVVFDNGNPDDLSLLENFKERLFDRTLRYGGSVSGEHGVGMGKRRGMANEVGVDAIAVMKSIKKTLDPKGLLNPGKLFLDYDVEEIVADQKKD